MLPDFPFDHDEYDMPMNLKALGSDSIVTVDERYRSELALKSEILAADHRYYCQAQPGSEALQWETVDLLLRNMARYYPEHFSLEIDGDRRQWTNRLLDTHTTFTHGESDSLPALAPGDRATRPLDWLGRQVQEDLLLMDGAPGSGTPLVAGQLCFAGSWCLDDKLGKSFLDIHHEVPQFADRIGRSADMAMQRLKGSRLVGRPNWNIVAVGRLNCAPVTLPEWVHARRGITMRNAGERCFLRIEWQTLSRLPLTNGILFTIHTTVQPIAAVVADPDRLRRFTNVIKGIPRPTLEYKNMAFFVDALVDYLEARAREISGRPATTARHMAAAADGSLPAAPASAPFLADDPGAAGEPYALTTTRILAGKPRATIRVLRRNGPNQPTYLAGIVTLQPSTIKRVYTTNETVHVLAGHAWLRDEDGVAREVKPGAMLSFAPDTIWTWEIVDRLRYTCVITM